MMLRLESVNTARAVRTTTVRRSVLKAAMLTATMALLASCGAHGATAKAPAEAGAGSAATAATVQIVDTAFQPASLSVAVGTKVVWTQTGVEPHSVTAVGGSFDSSPDCSPITPTKCLQKGDTFSHVFDHPGVYRYYCRVHGTPSGSGMAGTITVKAG